MNQKEAGKRSEVKDRTGNNEEKTENSTKEIREKCGRKQRKNKHN